MASQKSISKSILCKPTRTLIAQKISAGKLSCTTLRLSCTTLRVVGVTTRSVVQLRVFPKVEFRRCTRFCTLLLLLPLVLSGCQRFSGGQAMRQYQMESDRLLSEFRAQKKRAEDLEVRNGQLEQRLAESEKMLARGLGGSTGRSTANYSNRSGSNGKLIIGENQSDRNALGSLSESNSSRSSSRGPATIQRGGLPDTSPLTSGLLTSGGRGDPTSESQWRPVRRAAE